MWFFGKNNKKDNLRKILTAALFMGLGALLFKVLPMKIWGSEILFDASFHLMLTFLVLYILWFFIDQNKDWHISYFLFSALVLFIVAVQRIIDNAHNDVGLLLGLVISLVSIGVAERRNLKNKIKF